MQSSVRYIFLCKMCANIDKMHILMQLWLGYIHISTLLFFSTAVVVTIFLSVCSLPSAIASNSAPDAFVWNAMLHCCPIKHRKLFLFIYITKCGAALVRVHAAPNSCHCHLLNKLDIFMLHHTLMRILPTCCPCRTFIRQQIRAYDLRKWYASCYWICIVSIYVAKIAQECGACVHSLCNLAALVRDSSNSKSFNLPDVLVACGEQPHNRCSIRLTQLARCLAARPRCTVHCTRCRIIRGAGFGNKHDNNNNHRHLYWEPRGNAKSMHI